MTLLRPAAWRPSALHLNTITEIGAFATLAIFIAEFCILDSLANGRLAVPSGYDDVQYFIDGQRWLNGLHTIAPGDSFVALLNQHAPLHTLIAALSFAILGPYDWAPYAANGILLGITFWGVFRLLCAENVAIPKAGLIVFCLAFVPFMRFSITEFRPDIFYGVLLAFAIVVLFDRPVFLASRRRQFYLGLLFGLVLLSKPSVFPATTVFLGAATILSTAGFLIERRLPLKSAATPICKSFARIIAGAAIVFVPYLAVHGRETVEYIRQALTEDYWSYSGTFFDRAFYYATGPDGGGAALDFWFWIGLATMAARFVATRRTEPNNLIVVSNLYATLAIIYIGLSLPADRSYFHGCAFYATFLMVMVRDWGWFSTRVPAWFPAARTYAVYPVLAGVTLVGFGLSNKSPTLTGQEFQTGGEEVVATDRIWSVIQNITRAGSTEPLVLLTNSPEPVRDAALQLRGERQRLKVELSSGYFVRTPAEFVNLARQADLIVIANSIAHNLPGPKMGDELQAAMRNSDAFLPVGSLQGTVFPLVEVYVPKLPQKHD